MRLEKIAKFRKRCFEPGSEPSMATLRTLIEDGEIAGGRRFGNQYYVDLDVWESEEDSLVASVLSEHS